MKEFSHGSVSYEHKLSTVQSIYFPKHLHNEWEIYFFKNGTARFIVGNQLLELQNNDLLLIHPQVFHRAIIDSDMPYERIVINFPASKISQNIISIAEELPVKFNIDNQPFMKNLIASMESFLDDYDKNSASDAIIKSVELLFLHLLRYNNQILAAPPQNLFNNLFSEILNYIDEHICEKLTLEKLSKQFYSSSSWLSHSFKQNLGISCIKYINTKRILDAQRLIRQGYPPTEVFYRYSYTDYSTFFRQYKQVTGHSPEQDKV